MQKIWTIAWREIYTTFTDRNLLILMIVTPLALATIIGLGLGGLAENPDVAIQDIPLALVNLDQPNSQGVTFGDVYVDIIIPGGSDEGGEDFVANCEATGGADAAAQQSANLEQLLEPVELDDPEEARALVRDGTYAAAIIIPEDFSAHFGEDFGSSDESVAVEVFASSAAPISGQIVRAVAEGITNQILTGQISISATFGALDSTFADQPELGAVSGQAMQSDEDFAPDFSCAFDPAFTPLSIERQAVTGDAVSFNPLVYFGAANAVFFMMFTAQAGANSILQERRQGTIQRLIVTPTPRFSVLFGKLLGTLTNCFLQLIVLMLALTLVGSLIAGQLQFIWGRNILIIALVVIAASLAAGGLGTLLTSFARTPEQAGTIGSAVIILMAALSGSFFPVEALAALQPLPQLTLNYWAIDAFNRLSIGRTDVWLNMFILIALGAAMFSVGLFIFNRRGDI
ncbi:MAG: ABC transporter permease [Chloroflexi bacterium]|nr:ABC transporter permease [Chloroflexota bacterium]